MFKNNLKQIFSKKKKKTTNTKTDQVVFRCVRIVLFGTWFGTEEALVLTLRNFSPFSFQSKTVRRAVLEITDCLPT